MPAHNSGTDATIPDEIEGFLLSFTLISSMPLYEIKRLGIRRAVPAGSRSPRNRWKHESNQACRLEGMDPHRKSIER
jgi:hypothetical protein